MKKMFFLSLLCLTSFSTYAQWDFSGSVNLNTYIHEGAAERLPFWMYHNQRGRVSEDTHVSGWISGRTFNEFSNGNSLEIGAGVLYQDGIKDEIFLDEIYAAFNTDWLEAVVGRRQEKELYKGLSATNESMLWSINARPMPGISLATNRTIFFSPESAFGFEASWSEYLMGEDRFVKNARLHYKHINFVYQPNPDFQIKAGIRHFAQWGGDSPKTGQQPEGFSDYIRMVFGREGGENAVGGDQANVLGNHLGTYELEIIKRLNPELELNFIYNHMFEDGSGSRYANFPDGRYGVFLDFENNRRLINGILYEFFFTRNQSINAGSPHGADNYLNNFLTYHSGFTYESRIIGLPFFTYDEELDQVVNNKFAAHHLGISGNFSNYFVSYPWKLLLSFSHNEGRYGQFFNPNQDVYSGLFDIKLLQSFVQLNVQFGVEVSNVAKPLYGAGLNLSKQF
ncbi:capsule assembly Wzi family protein [Salegentibacter sp. JZCK2]|uniref:capsule assembly Wzi family protein n=1 Tax=Salegentibacter tibetensis TaxID=2873600 RepID=UPI001CCF5A00|nr:capsule assembly Wzi family protein [Salegentibacter tibetensis]MBZ9728703.1 capsule assembly Wzi family protein [Salegentibacter tibetensis]